MDNEVQIITMLQTMAAAIETLSQGQNETHARLDKLESKVDKLESKVDKLDFKVDKLESKVDRLETGQTMLIHDVKAIFEQTQDLVEFEAETRLSFIKASKKLDAVQRVTKDNTYNIAELQSRAI